MACLYPRVQLHRAELWELNSLSPTSRSEGLRNPQLRSRGAARTDASATHERSSIPSLPPTGRATGVSRSLTLDVAVQGDHAGPLGAAERGVVDVVGQGGGEAWTAALPEGGTDAAVYAFYDALGSFETTPGTTASAASGPRKRAGRAAPGPQAGLPRSHLRKGGHVCPRTRSPATRSGPAPRPRPRPEGPAHPAPTWMTFG